VTLGVLRRLALITAIAVAIAVLYKPDGWVVFIGLMVFQMVTLGTVLAGLTKQVRHP
jgi:hypothetical protein